MTTFEITHSLAFIGGIGMGYWVLIGCIMLASWLTSRTLKKRFAEHSQVGIAFSGKEIAERMLAENGLHDVQVLHTPGQLTDHYDPRKKTVNLSESVYQQRNVAAAAVAAHECGHAIQHAKSYAWLTMRSKMVPALTVTSSLMNVILMVAIFGMVAMQSPLLLWIYVGCLAVTTLFSLITLPVEFDASKRALAWMEGSRVSSAVEHERAKNALHWAAMTYVVAALGSVATLVYYLSILLNNRD